MLKYKFIIRSVICKFILIVALRINLSAQQTISFNVFFSSGSALLSIEEEQKASTFLNTLDTALISNISICGYCNDIGSNKYNNTLSKKRANSIRLYLVGWGIKSSVISNVDYKGELALMQSSNKTINQQRAFNRMAEIIIETRPKKRIPSVIKKIELDSTKKIAKTEERPKSFKDILKIGDTIVFEDITFKDNSHKFHPDSYPTLNMLLHDLKQNKQYNILVMGHICCVAPNYDGRDALDTETGLLNLSAARAKAVVDYLIKKGIKPHRLKYTGLKGYYPTGKGDFYDKRVEIKIMDLEK